MKIIKTIGNVKHKDKQTIITIPAILFKDIKYVEIEIKDETLVLKPVEKDRVELGIEQEKRSKRKAKRRITEN